MERLRRVGGPASFAPLATGGTMEDMPAPNPAPSRGPIPLVPVIALAVVLATGAGPARSQGSIGVHVRNTGGFVPRGGGGIVTDTVSLDTEIPLTPGAWVPVGGLDRSTTSVSGISGPGGTSRSVMTGGGGTGVFVRVTEVPVAGAQDGDPRAPSADRFHRATGPEILAALSDPDPVRKQEALIEIRRRRTITDRARLALTRIAVGLLTDPDPAVALQAGRTVAFLEDPAAEELLISHARDPAAPRLALVLWTLGRLGPVRSVPLLRTHSVSSRETVARAARAALGRSRAPR